MERPHAPTPRRRALARDAGRVLTSPAWTASLALAAGTVAAIAVTAGTARGLAADARERLAHAADPDAPARALATAGGLAHAVVAVMLPIALAALAGALLGQAAAARGLWIPRRTVRNAPAGGADPLTAGDRVAEAVVAVVRASVLGGVGAYLVVDALPALAALPVAGAAHPGGATAALDAAPIGAAAAASQLGAVAGSALATLAIAAVVTSTLELIVRQRRLARELAMTDREQREDARDTHGDPAVRRARTQARDDDRAIVAGARVVIAGDALAVAITWLAGDRPRPARVGRGLDARRLLAAARHARVPIVADDDLCRRLSDEHAAVPDAALPPLAAVLAAVGATA